jgi:hypothetical protein
MSCALGLCLAETNSRILLFWRKMAFKFLRDFLIVGVCLLCWGLFGGYGNHVLSKRFLHTNSLKDCFPFCFCDLNSFMLRKMFQVFWMNIGLVGLCFRGVMELL